MVDFKTSRLGDLLVDHGVISKEELTKAIRAQKRSKDKLRIGAVLVDLGLATAADIEAFLQKQVEMRTGGPKTSDKEVASQMAAFKTQMARMRKNIKHQGQTRSSISTIDTPAWRSA